MLKLIAITLPVACLAALPARADQSHNMKMSVRVGQTKKVVVLAAHKADCTTSNERSVEITQPPSLGSISQRDNVPVVTQHSLSGTCIGSQVMGTEVDYTATAAGTDHFVVDGVFSNGRAHYTVTVVNR